MLYVIKFCMYLCHTHTHAKGAHLSFTARAIHGMWCIQQPSCRKTCSLCILLTSLAALITFCFFLDVHPHQTSVSPHSATAAPWSLSGDFWLVLPSAPSEALVAPVVGGFEAVACRARVPKPRPRAAVLLVIVAAEAVIIAPVNAQRRVRQYKAWGNVTGHARARGAHR